MQTFSEALVPLVPTVVVAADRTRGSHEDVAVVSDGEVLGVRDDSVVKLPQLVDVDIAVQRQVHPVLPAGPESTMFNAR